MYTIRDAYREIGDSTDWRLARKVSLKKWRQIVAGDAESYPPGAYCGFCIVADNRSLDCEDCPFVSFCKEMGRWSESEAVSRADEVVRALEALEL